MTMVIETNKKLKSQATGMVGWWQYVRKQTKKIQPDARRARGHARGTKFWGQARALTLAQR